MQRFNFKGELIKLGLDSLLVDQWMLIRINRNNSEHAFNLFLSELSEFAPEYWNTILAYIVKKKWIGFRAKWIMKAEKKTVQEQNEDIFSKILNSQV
jgi:hypothetical protein